MKLSQTHKLDQFGGIDNVNVLTELEQINDFGHKYYFQSAKNVDLTNKGHVRRRDGYRTRQTFTGQTVHSLWADGPDCFFMLDDGLCRLNEDLSYTILLSGFGPLSMNYVKMYNKTFFTNFTEIGWIDEDGVSALPSPTDNFKNPMPAGQLIEAYNNSLYVARGNLLYYSDPTMPAQYDYRRGIIPFPSRITMLKAVDDGLWVSDSENIYFLGGSTGFDFAAAKRAEYAVIERSAVGMDGKYLGTDSVSRSILMLTHQGICLGSTGGNFLNLTDERYHGTEGFIVRDAAVRITRESYQYIIMGYDTASNDTLSLTARMQIPEDAELSMSTPVV